MESAVRKPRLPAAAGLCAALLLWASATQAADGRSSQQRARETQVIDLVDRGDLKYPHFEPSVPSVLRDRNLFDAIRKAVLGSDA